VKREASFCGPAHTSVRQENPFEVIFLSYARGIVVLLLLLSSTGLSTRAQDFNAAGFDPTPVQISARVGY